MASGSAPQLLDCVLLLQGLLGLSSASISESQGLAFQRFSLNLRTPAVKGVVANMPFRTTTRALQWLQLPREDHGVAASDSR